MALLKNSEVVTGPWGSDALGFITACFNFAQGHIRYSLSGPHTLKWLVLQEGLIG